MATNASRNRWLVRYGLLFDAFVGVIGSAMQIAFAYGLSYAACFLLHGVLQDQLFRFIAKAILSFCMSLFPVSVAPVIGWVLALSPLVIFSYGVLHALVHEEFGNVYDSNFLGLVLILGLPILTGMMLPFVMGVSVIKACQVAGIFALGSATYWEITSAMGSGAIMGWLALFIDPDPQKQKAAQQNSTEQGMKPNLEIPNQGEPASSLAASQSFTPLGIGHRRSREKARKTENVSPKRSEKKAKTLALK